MVHMLAILAHPASGTEGAAAGIPDTTADMDHPAH